MGYPFRTKDIQLSVNCAHAHAGLVPFVCAVVNNRLAGYGRWCKLLQRLYRIFRMIGEPYI